MPARAAYFSTAPCRLRPGLGVDIHIITGNYYYY